MTSIEESVRKTYLTGMTDGLRVAQKALAEVRDGHVENGLAATELLVVDGLIVDFARVTSDLIAKFAPPDDDETDAA